MGDTDTIHVIAERKMKIRGRENLSNFKGIVITVCQDGHEKNDTSGLNDIVMLELTIENATVGC